MSATETAARAYIEAWFEPARAAELLGRCFAERGTIVASATRYDGRDAVLAAVADFAANPRGIRLRRPDRIDVQGRLFRFRALFEHADGTVTSITDIGEVDDAGQIIRIYTLRDEATP